MPTSLATSQMSSVSYPSAGRNSNMSQQQQQSTLAAPSIQNQRVFTGIVTKVHDNFGFVDDDVFFQMRLLMALSLCHFSPLTHSFQPLLSMLIMIYLTFFVEAGLNIWLKFNYRKNYQFNWPPNYYNISS